MQISKSLVFMCDKNELSGVKKIAAKVCNDVKLVFGAMPQLMEYETQWPSFEETAEHCCNQWQQIP